ncbi:pepsin/retropepsin-like aspartic protease family protein [Filimonas effusa]|uniref:Aspartyl protease n=1 Tax=Filimonas effusa TaxID=2508721 RepID=A0A4Q1D478_9BACT|nr:hypothetical protein [Filimonas effusa]RXK83148.1 hypothetical protein ESB13_13595 [Filimonas effusa]
MKWLFVFVCFCASFSTSFGQHRSYSDIADSVYAALKKHEPGFLLPLLHDSCRISGLPKGMNAKMIPLLLDKYPAVQAYKIVTINKDTAGTRVQMEVMFETGKAAYPDFVLNQHWRITELNVVKSASFNRLANRILAAPDTIHLPLITIRQRLYVKAEADGRKGLFLLDTGSPDMILNRTFFNDSLQLVSASGTESINGVRGDGILTRRISGFTLGRMKLSNFSAFVMNEGIGGEAEGLPFLGSIGYNVLRDFEWRFDLPAGKLILVKTDDNGDYISQQYRLTSMKYMGPLEMRRHVPVAVITISDMPFRMGIDCSIGSNVFFARSKNELLPYMSQIDPATAAQEGVPANGIQGVLNKALIGTLEFSNMPASIEQGSFVYDNAEVAPLNGLLGTAFLGCYKTVINLKKKLICFW